MRDWQPFPEIEVDRDLSKHPHCAAWRGRLRYRITRNVINVEMFCGARTRRGRGVARVIISAPGRKSEICIRFPCNTCADPFPAKHGTGESNEAKSNGLTIIDGRSAGVNRADIRIHNGENRRLILQRTQSVRMPQFAHRSEEYMATCLVRLGPS